jgi:hypothetical protein
VGEGAMPSRAEADTVIASSARPIRAIRLIMISSRSHDCDVRHKLPVERLFRHLRSKIKNGILQPPFLFIPAPNSGRRIPHSSGG